jgi:hypothetical protein
VIASDLLSALRNMKQERLAFQSCLPFTAKTLA